MSRSGFSAAPTFDGDRLRIWLAGGQPAIVAKKFFQRVPGGQVLRIVWRWRLRIEIVAFHRHAAKFVTEIKRSSCRYRIALHPMPVGRRGRLGPLWPAQR